MVAWLYPCSLDRIVDSARSTGYFEFIHRSKQTKNKKQQHQTTDLVGIVLTF